MPAVVLSFEQLRETIDPEATYVVQIDDGSGWARPAPAHDSELSGVDVLHAVRRAVRNYALTRTATRSGIVTLTDGNVSIRFIPQPVYEDTVCAADECEEPTEDGEGWDGLCGTCADRTYSAEAATRDNHDAGLPPAHSSNAHRAADHLPAAPRPEVAATPDPDPSEGADKTSTRHASGTTPDSSDAAPAATGPPGRRGTGPVRLGGHAGRRQARPGIRPPHPLAGRRIRRGDPPRLRRPHHQRAARRAAPRPPPVTAHRPVTTADTRTRTEAP